MSESRIKNEIIPYLEFLLGSLRLYSFAYSSAVNVEEYICPELKFVDRQGQFSVFLTHNIVTNKLVISWWQVTKLFDFPKKVSDKRITLEEIILAAPTEKLQNFIIYHFDLLNQDFCDFNLLALALQDFYHENK